MGSVVHLIGKGYNLVTGESMVEDVFEYETVRNDFGILVPATAKSSANKSAQGNIHIYDVVHISNFGSFHFALLIGVILDLVPTVPSSFEIK